MRDTLAGKVMPAVVAEAAVNPEMRKVLAAFVHDRRRPAFTAIRRGVARALDTGVLSINSNTSVRVATPFGGFKQSGVGRELGPHALEHYTELKTVYYATGG